MAENPTTLYVLVAIVIVAILGMGIAAASFATDESVGRMMGGGYGGGMMGGTTGTTTAASTPGALEWTLLVLSAAFLGAAIVLLFRARQTPRGRADPAPPVPGGSPAAVAEAAPPAPAPAAAPAPSAAAATPIPDAAAATGGLAETALVKLLNEDERRMYLEIRGHGGVMLQRDLVALGMFSKAKVTRVLDKLESKGVVVREAHGMTNRVRLVTGVAK